jgi:DNA-binding response OmpR family regulator
MVRGLKHREDEETSTIPTIMITANAREPADVARGMKLGADDYLYKPFAPQELLARAQSKIKARQLRCLATPQQRIESTAQCERKAEPVFEQASYPT